MSLPTFHIPLIIFGFVSLALYILIIVALIRFRRSNSALKGSFFNLVLVHSIADIGMFLAFNIFMRGRKYGLLALDKNIKYVWLARISTALHYYLKMVMYVGHTAFAANRLTAACFPTSYEPLWTTFRLCIFWLFQWTVPLAFTLPIAFNGDRDIWIDYWKEQDTYRLQNDEDTTQVISYIDGTTCLIATCLCIGFYMATFIAISRQLGKRNVHRAFMVEVRLMVASFTVFIIFFLNTLAQMLAVLYAKWQKMDAVMFLNDLTYPLLDIFCMAQPWALILTSPGLRNAVLGLFNRADPFRSGIGSTQGRSTKNGSLVPTQTTLVSPLNGN